MSRGIKIGLIILIIVIVIAGIMFLIWALITKPPIIFKPSSVVTNQPKTTPGLSGGQGTGLSGTGTATEEVALPFALGQPEEVEQQKVLSLAGLFAERFGSFSNQGDFENVEDLLPLMTETMQSWARDYIVQGRVSQASDEAYYGMLTKVITSDIKSFNLTAGTATIEINTQRRETKKGQADRIFYQALELGLSRLDGAWLVASATWK
ncbi:hypothetical protein KJ969_01105 [Patescibacteria group bacterium]|nr:hypothetical protein [Patescibacteria group bacterium]MBU1922085.1 hypothetical protein [Patescibacteria group bacterium]